MEFCSGLKKNGRNCGTRRKGNAIGDGNIKQKKPDSEQQITCFLSYVDPRLYIDAYNSYTYTYTIHEGRVERLSAGKKESQKEVVRGLEGRMGLNMVKGHDIIK